MQTTPYLWGGLLESLEYCDDKEELLQSKNTLTDLKAKITLIENSTNCKEIKVIMSGFALENKIPSALGLGHSKWVSYLNSPLLDEIYDTIDKFRPMLECCRKNKPKALEFYLTKEKFYKRNKGFLVASRKGYTEIIKILIKYGVNIRIKDDDALQNAVDNNYVEIAEILLRNGAYWRPALYTVVKKGYMEILESLWKYCTHIFTKEEINVAFCSACHDEKNLHIVKFLVEKYKNTTDVFSGLINGAVSGCEEIVMFLLETYNITSLKNAKFPEYGIYRFWTPMTAAISGKNERIINKFFELNADITPDCLDFACALNTPDLAKKLAGYLPITEECLKAASENNNRELLNFLMERYRGSYRILFMNTCGWQCNLEVAKIFYEKYKNSEEYKDTCMNVLNCCLHSGCVYHKPEIVEFVLSCGADPNYVMAIRELLNHKEILELLVKYGASIRDDKS